MSSSSPHDVEDPHTPSESNRSPAHSTRLEKDSVGDKTTMTTMNDVVARRTITPPSSNHHSDDDDGSTTEQTQSPRTSNEEGNAGALTKEGGEDNNEKRNSSSSKPSLRGKRRLGVMDLEHMSPEERQAVRDELAEAPPKKASWLLAAFMVVADIIGVGVMSLTSGYVTVGWVIGVISTVAWGAFAMWIGLIMEENWEAFPSANTLADMGYHAFGGSNKAKQIVATWVYLNIFMTMSEFALVMGQSLGFVFYDSGVCSVAWVWIGIAVALPMVQYRELSREKWLLFVNYGFITVSLLIALIYFSVVSDPQLRGPTNVVGEDMDVLDFFKTQALFCFAYGGASIFLEFISEMKHPRNFRKSIAYCSAPLITGTYLITACWSYALLGTSESQLLISNILPSPSLRASGAFLFFHMTVVFTLYGTVLSRAIHRRISPDTVNKYNKKSILLFLAISTSLAILNAIISLLIPFFSEFTSLIGSVTIPFTAYIFPMGFVLIARRRGGKRTPLWQLILMGVLTVYLLLVVGIGFAGTVRSIASSWSTTGKPFQCSPAGQMGGG